MTDTKNEVELAEVILPAGHLVTINGIPFELSSTVIAKTHPGNIKLAFPEGVPNPACNSGEPETFIADLALGV